MSLGFQEAGFNILAGFEHWNTAISCYKKNFSHPVEDVDLSDVDLSVKTIAKYTPDIIIGGPPCQDFSGAGNRIEGDRADLTIAYANIIQKVSPQYFVMENVERAASSNGYKNGPDSFLDGLLSTNQSVFPLTVREYFTQENYNLSTEYYYRHPRSYKRRGIFSVDEPSPTIRGVNRPKPNNYKKHSGDLVFPDGVRNLTALERSLIQTFPPNFVWDDSSASTEQMIGNAVPVKLAHYVATCLMRFINGDTDLHNLRFIDWLKKEKNLSAEVAGDTLSRIGRARRILDFEDNDCETYLKKLNEENLFKGIVPSVRAQIRRAVRLYFEYVSNHTEVES